MLVLNRHILISLTLLIFGFSDACPRRHAKGEAGRDALHHGRHQPLLDPCFQDEQRARGRLRPHRCSGARPRPLRPVLRTRVTHSTDPPLGIGNRDIVPSCPGVLSRPVLSYPLLSYPVPFCDIPFCYIPSRLASSRPILSLHTASRSVLFRPIPVPPYPGPSYPVPSCFFTPCPVLPWRVLSCAVPFRPPPPMFFLASGALVGDASVADRGVCDWPEGGC